MNNKDSIESCALCSSRPEWAHWTGSNRCPECGGADIEYNTQVVLTSNSPQSQLRCKSCGHIFSSGVVVEWTNNDALDEMYQQAKSILGIHEIRDPLPGEIPYVGDWPISNESNRTTPLNYGWICPKCGRSLSPHIDSCPYCNSIHMLYEDTTTISFIPVCDNCNYVFDRVDGKVGDLYLAPMVCPNCHKTIECAMLPTLDAKGNLHYEEN